MWRITSAAARVFYTYAASCAVFSLDAADGWRPTYTDQRRRLGCSPTQFRADSGNTPATHRSHDALGAAALTLALAVPGVAQAEWYFTQYGAQRAAQDFVADYYSKHLRLGYHDVLSADRPLIQPELQVPPLSVRLGRPERWHAGSCADRRQR